jgi:adenine-specific DNA methylase
MKKSNFPLLFLWREKWEKNYNERSYVTIKEIKCVPIGSKMPPQSFKWNHVKRKDNYAVIPSALSQNGYHQENRN